MSRYCKTVLFFLGALALLPCPASAQNPRVIRRIEITSTWSEMGGGPGRAHKESSPSATDQPGSTHLVIHRQGEVYLRDDHAVDASLVAALAKALSAPAKPEPSLDDLGVTPAWLKANASAVAKHFAETRVTNNGPVHERMLESTFADPVTVNKVVPSLFDKRHYSCADCGRPILLVKVAVNFEDFTTLEASSSSRFPFMLPWRLAGTATDTTAFNADISRAIAALMPEKSTNRARLAGENLATELGGAVMMVVEHQAQMLDVEGKTGGTFHTLRSRYTIEFATIDNYGDPALRAPESKAVDESQEPNLHLQLQVADPPHNFFDDEVSLRIVNGNVVGVDDFLQSVPDFEKLVLSVSWLNQYAQQHPDVRYRLDFVHTTSFGDAAKSVFAADMQAIGRDKVMPAVDAAKGGVALLMVGSGAEESDWLIFPDQHMLLWRYFQTPLYGKPSLVKWGPANFEAKPCAKLQNNFVHCVGAEITPDGKLKHGE
ncbi:MAG TPA: hypothetical protein VKR60_03520 [Candidatus Sulfotelmatobacter sp.]|nr:hypothetical protein [Candidatus Sulfotelmatobacter sp.]